MLVQLLLEILTQLLLEILTHPEYASCSFYFYTSPLLFKHVLPSYVTALPNVTR